MHPRATSRDLFDLQARSTARKPTQVALDFTAIAEAVDDLAALKYQFTTKDVAHHPAVTAAHGGLCQDPRFDQQIGSYLTNALGRLKIMQTSPKGQANARWRRREVAESSTTARITLRGGFGTPAHRGVHRCSK